MLVNGNAKVIRGLEERFKEIVEVTFPALLTI